MLDGGSEPPWEGALLKGKCRGHFPARLRAPLTGAADVGIFSTLSTRVTIGRPLKQSGVKLTFSNEKSAPAMRPLVKIIWQLVMLCGLR